MQQDGDLRQQLLAKSNETDRKGIITLANTDIRHEWWAKDGRDLTAGGVQEESGFEHMGSAQRKRWLNSVDGYQRVLPGGSVVRVHDAAENF